MAANQSGKGNPASKRMSNPKRKAARERSWERAQKRHKRNREAGEASAALNKQTRESGGLTPWEEARQARREHRAAAQAARQAKRGAA